MILAERAKFTMEAADKLFKLEQKKLPFDTPCLCWNSSSEMSLKYIKNIYIYTVSINAVMETSLVSLTLHLENKSQNT